MSWNLVPKKKEIYTQKNAANIKRNDQAKRKRFPKEIYTKISLKWFIRRRNANYKQITKKINFRIFANTNNKCLIIK